MNKQGLVSLLMMEKISAEVKRRGKNYAKGYEKGIDLAIKLIEASDEETTKPVVPQFVADWYEKRKNSLEFNIFDYVYRFDKKEESDLKNWFNDINTYPFQTLVNMHQFGYEVEKEKRYLVKVKNVLTRQGALNRNKKSGRFIFSNPEENSLYDTKFTHKELEDAGFGWVFDCEGIEVEEVE